MKFRRRITLTLLGIALAVGLFWAFQAETNEDLISVLGDNILTAWTSLIALVPRLVFLFFLYVIFRILFFFLFELVFKRLIAFDYEARELASITKVLKFIYWSIFLLTALSLLFGNITALFTSIGLIGFGITFALQKPILNFVGWLNIVWKGIYNIGDRIEVDNVRGDVRDLSLMNTVLDSLLPGSDLPSGKIVTIPNELVLTTDVENYTKESNYIVDELSITITYESDFCRGKELLHDIAWKVTKDNRQRLKKTMRAEQDSIEKELLKLARIAKKGKRKEKKSAKEEIAKLEAEKEELKQKQEDEFYKEFRPKIRLEMQDSAIQLICQFITPYDKIKFNRTKINEAFLQAIKKEKKIEVAYPHMQIVTHDKTSKDGAKVTIKKKK